MAGKDNEHHRPALAQKKHAPEKPLPEWFAERPDSASRRIQGGRILFQVADGRLLKCPALFLTSSRKFIE